MSRLALVRDARFQNHKTPPAHPESPQRLASIDKVFMAQALEEGIEEVAPRAASEEEICLVHAQSYVERLQNKSHRLKNSDSYASLDADTFMSEDTFEIAKLAAGAGLAGVDAIADQYSSAFVAVRPPGHHAFADRSMGFCLFNNIAIATRYAQKKFGFKRVLIVDWDVHHGNGTEAAFYKDPTVMFTSMHQFPFYPVGSGWYKDDGAGEGKGYNMNIPLPEGTGDRGYLAAWDQLLKPVALEYKPDLIMLSAGYDGHINDPLGGQRISTIGFAMLTQRIADLCRLTNSRCVGFLEGGYDLKSLADSAVATMRVLNAGSHEELAQVHTSYIVKGAATGEEPVNDDHSPYEVDERIQDVRRHFSQYWKELR